MKRKDIAFITILIVCLSIAYTVLPMILMGRDYSYTIHDGLDSYAGWAQALHDHHLYFGGDQTLPAGIRLDKMYLGLSYNLYDFLNCVLGYLPGQMLTRVIGVPGGFFACLLMMKKLFPKRNAWQENLIWLMAACYAVTPCAPNRTIAFAALPFAVWLFLTLSEKRTFSKWALLGLVYPFFSNFAAAMIFVLGLWFVFTIFDWVRNKALNFNLSLTFFLLCVSTIGINCDYFGIALSANQTNRSLTIQSRGGSFLSLWKNYLLYGQYHSTPVHRQVLLPFLLVASGLLALQFLYDKYKNNVISEERRHRLLLIIGGWFFWFASAAVEAFQESGATLGITAFDGLQWGRVIGLMRCVWYIMFAAVVFSIPPKKFGYLLCYLVLLLQMGNVAISLDGYNDVLISNLNSASRGPLHTVLDKVDIHVDRPAITFGEFFSEPLFDEIKKDINYTGEYVAAYGYHPSVLMYNGFHTLDTYVSVHTMDTQLAFREIIAPVLEHHPEVVSGYDTWGGRMYLFGELSYVPTFDKQADPAPLYIDTAAFKKYGGRYILSRAEISNAEEIGLTFVKDYDREDSLYHIYLYAAL